MKKEYIKFLAFLIAIIPTFVSVQCADPISVEQDGNRVRIFVDQTDEDPFRSSKNLNQLEILSLKENVSLELHPRLDKNKTLYCGIILGKILPNESRWDVKRFSIEGSTIEGSIRIDKNTVNKVVRAFPNLEDLDLGGVSEEPRVFESLVKLRNLQKLSAGIKQILPNEQARDIGKLCHLTHYKGAVSQLLIDFFLQNNVPISNLTITTVWYFYHSYLPQILNLPRLTSLGLTSRRLPNFRLPNLRLRPYSMHYVDPERDYVDQRIVEIMTDHPKRHQLTELWVRDANPQIIRDLVKLCPQLTSFSLANSRDDAIISVQEIRDIEESLPHLMYLDIGNWNLLEEGVREECMNFYIRRLYDPRGPLRGFPDTYEFKKYLQHFLQREHDAGDVALEMFEDEGYPMGSEIDPEKTPLGQLVIHSIINQHTALLQRRMF